jgi:hypothetical protein
MHAVATEAIHSPGRCTGCGRPWRSPAGSLVNAATSMGDAIMKVLGGVGQMAGARTKGCSCDDCSHVAPDCSCRCCVSDADLLIYTRLGERRVVPVNIENTRRRERDVEVSLSAFTTSSGKPLDIQGNLMPPTSFTLGPCEEREIAMLLAVREPLEEGGEEEKPSRASDLREPRELPDVDECLVGYADLSVTGCNLRPVRIAMAILPRDCASYSVGCGCGCC